MRILRNSILFIAIVCFTAAVITGCSLPQVQQGTAQLATAATQAQSASQSLQTQLDAATAALAAAPKPEDVAKLKAQVAGLQAQLLTAATQPGVDVTSLELQIASLKAQIAAAPTLADIQKLQAQVATLAADKAKADGILAQATTALQAAATGAANAQTTGQAIGAVVSAAAQPAAAIPTWGWAVSLGLALLGNYLQSNKNTSLKQAATSIVQGIGVAAAAGQITVTPAALDTLNTIQTPLAKQIVDDHQTDTGSKSLGELTTPLAKAA